MKQPLVLLFWAAIYFYSQEAFAIAGGIGASLGANAEGAIEVKMITPNSPAGKTGIKVGDLIVGIQKTGDSQITSTKGLSLENVISMLRGDVGTAVTIVVKRGTKEVKGSLVRAEIDTSPAVLANGCKDGNFQDCYEGITWGQLLKVPSPVSASTAENPSQECNMDITKNDAGVHLPYIENIGTKLSDIPQIRYFDATGNTAEPSCLILFNNQFVGFARDLSHRVEGALTEQQIMLIKATLRQKYGAPQESPSPDEVGYYLFKKGNLEVSLTTKGGYIRYLSIPALEAAKKAVNSAAQQSAVTKKKDDMKSVKSIVEGL